MSAEIVLPSEGSAIRGRYKMKKILCLVLCAALLSLCCACAPGNTGDDGGDAVTEEVKIQPLTERQNVSYALSGTDDVGRKIEPAGEATNDRLVGIFYVLWLGNDYSDEGEPYFDGIYDISKMDFNTVFSGSGSPFLKHHFYAEPLFGYYNMQDYWVVERHVQMFIAAGIDFLGIDATNNNIYKGPLTILLEILEKYCLEGYKVPKIMFLTNTNSHERVQQLYDFIYKDNRYQELWFTDTDEGRNPDGKPWLTMRSEQQVYLPKAVRDKFYFRDSQWPNEPFKDNGFPWIEYERPQPVHNGVISVSVAQNSGMHMSNSVQFKESPNDIDYYNQNWGRGYTTEGKNNEELIDEGANFQEQWDVAIQSQDARIAFILEWNEWAALKLATEVVGIGNTVVFFDCVTPEFSRDIEPISGFFGDNYYMQMIKNIREFKGQSGSGISVETAALQADRISENWNVVQSGVADFAGQKTRDFINCDGSGRYQNTTKRNDIVEVRVAQDNSNYYFLLTANEEITAADGSEWMNLWLKTSESTDGYDFVINRSRENGKASVEKLVGGNGETVGDAEYIVNGKYIQFTVAKSLLGDHTSFEFKATDNVDLLSDIMLLYTTGDSAPYGRLNYLFTK